MTIAVLALIALLSLADVATTLYAIAHGFGEANPLFGQLFARLPRLASAAVMVALKLLGCGLFALLILRVPTWWPLGALYAAALAYVVAHNVAAIRKG